MKLYNIYYLCKSNLQEMQNLQFIKKDYGITGEYDFVIENWGRYESCYNVIKQIDFLKPIVNNILELKHSYDEEKDNLCYVPSNAEVMQKHQNFLVSKMETVVELYESLDLKSSANGIDIKLPECDSLKEYIQYMKDIDFILNQCPLISQCEEEIVFNSVDIGSSWVSFIIKSALGSHIILDVLAKMSDIAMNFRLSSCVVKQQEELLKTMRQKNEIGEEVLQGFKMLKKSMLEEGVKELENSCNTKIEDLEDRDRAARAIENLAILIDKGVEIYSSIEAPREVRAQFPFKENAPILTDDLQKMIEEKDDLGQ